jgi:hypothetical protein
MMKAHARSLNTISYDGVIKMLEIIRDVKPNPPFINEVYVDTVGDPETYKSRLQMALGTLCVINMMNVII